MAYSDTQGGRGGFGSASPLAMFRDPAWLEDWQDTFETEMVVSKLVPVKTLADPAYRYEVHEALISDSGKLDPEPWLPGARVPRITVDEISTASGAVSHFAYAAELTPSGQKSFTDVRRHKDAMLDWAADFAERTTYNGIAGDTNNSKAWTDNSEFDTFFGSAANGGYITSGSTDGVENTIAIGQADTYEWDADAGDPISDFVSLAVMMENQLRVQGTATTSIKMNPANSVCLLDVLSYGALYNHLKFHEFAYEPVYAGGRFSGVTVPGIMGLTFLKADRALPTGTVNIGGTTTGYGMAVLFDRGDVPFRGFQWFEDINGWNRAGSVQGWDLQTYNAFTPNETGNFFTAMQMSMNVEVHYPKKLVLYGGFRSAEVI